MCKSRQISYGRKRREIITNSSDANVYEINKTSKPAPDELPLHSWIYVQDDNIHPDYFLSGPHSKHDTFLIDKGGKYVEYLLLMIIELYKFNLIK